MSYHRGADDSSDESSSEDRGVQHYLPVTCTGRQPGSQVFVFSPTLQLDKYGNVIPPDEQQYLWIPHILDKLHRVVNPLPAFPLSLHCNALQKVIRGIQHLCGDNVYSGVFLLGE